MSIPSVFEVVSALFQSVEKCVAAANRIGKAYADGVKHPEYYTPYRADNPEKVAINLAGLYAADTAANILALVRYGLNPLDENPGIGDGEYIEALRRIAGYGEELDSDELFIAQNLANATWRAGQPFRGMIKNPLGLLTRSINGQFNLLPLDQKKKDLVQVREGARIILEELQAYGYPLSSSA